TTFGCHHLRPRDATFPWDSLRLLQAMAPKPPEPCHQQQEPFFPHTRLHTNHTHRDAATATALHILDRLFDILSSPSTPQHWHAQARRHLLNTLQHYSHHLEQCLTDNGTLLKAPALRNLRLSIDDYFSRIQDFLHTHNHSACAWDQVRREAQACFKYLDTLIR
ncbi:IFN protein, partial [Heliornis fulica]|nr:IFN protein [Heliornis fulica]